jgi:hypothetical protein
VKIIQQGLRDVKMGYLSDISVTSHHPCRELSQHLLAAQDGKDVVAEVAGDLGLDVIEADEFVA